MSLAEDIRSAADTIDKLNAHMAFGDKSSWNSTELRRTAHAVEEEEREASAREALVEKLARDWRDMYWGSMPVKHKSWEDLPDDLRETYLKPARGIIESGWRPS